MNSTPSKFDADTAEGIVRSGGDSLPHDKQGSAPKRSDAKAAPPREKSGAAEALKKHTKDAKGI